MSWLPTGIPNYQDAGRCLPDRNVMKAGYLVRQAKMPDGRALV